MVIFFVGVLGVVTGVVADSKLWLLEGLELGGVSLDDDEDDDDDDEEDKDDFTSGSSPGFSVCNRLFNSYWSFVAPFTDDFNDFVDDFSCSQFSSIVTFFWLFRMLFAVSSSLAVIFVMLLSPNKKIVGFLLTIIYKISLLLYSFINSLKYNINNENLFE